MALQTSGQITLSQVQSEFGGSNPISLKEYYRNGGLVPSTITTGTAAGAWSTYYGNTTTYYWRVIGSQIIRWANVNVYNSYTTGNSITIGNYEYQRQATAFSTIAGGKAEPSTYYYRVRRRTKSTLVTTTVNSNIPVSPNQITLKTMYGGRNT